MKKYLFWAPILALALVASACTSPAASPSPIPSPFATEIPATATPLPTATPAPTETPTPQPISVTNFPDPSAYSWQLIVSGLRRPVNMTNSADGSGRLFILEQAGLVRVVASGALQTTPFLDIRDRVGSGGNEQGLLGIAFHPNFSQNGYIFVDYTDHNGNTVISRFHLDPMVAPDAQIADSTSEKVLLQIKQPYANHNGGHILFGPDGMLWIGMGDGGGQGDPNNNGQSTQTLLGKLLRIDVDHGDPYAIPTDNPFASGAGLPEIWAYGLRNPWVFSFDSLTHDLYVADVGQDKWEEINFLPAGFSSAPANFGWSLLEGSHPYKQGNAPLPGNLITPVYEYSHALGCSVIGGSVYRGQDLPAFNGIYLFGDYCSGTIWGLLHLNGSDWQAQDLFHTAFKIVAFGADERGELYLLDLNGGLYKLAAK